MLTLKRKLDILCDINGTTKAAVARHMGVSKSALTKYEESMPSGDKLIEMAQYFCVNPEYLTNLPLTEKRLNSNPKYEEVVNLLELLDLSNPMYEVLFDLLVSLKKNMNSIP